MARRLLVVASILSVAVSFPILAKAATATNSPGKTVVVDCSKHHSINDALQDSAPQLVIEVVGVCAENVVITRDNVTLRGSGAGATIDGATLPAPRLPGIAVTGATNVGLENLTIRNMSRGVSAEYGAAVRIDGLHVEDNSHGIIAISNSSLKVSNSTARRNSQFGISVWAGSAGIFSGSIVASENELAGIVVDASSLECLNYATLEVDDNEGYGLYLQEGASVALYGIGTSVAVRRNAEAGIEIDSGSSVSVNRLECSGNGTGVVVWGGRLMSRFATITENLEGGVWAAHQSAVELTDAVVSHNGWGLSVEGSSQAWLRRTSIQSNDEGGMGLDSSMAQLAACDVSDVELSFGYRASFDGGLNTVGSISCDGTGLIRGAACSSPVTTALTAVPRHKDRRERETRPRGFKLEH